MRFLGKRPVQALQRKSEKTFSVCVRNGKKSYRIDNISKKFQNVYTFALGVDFLIQIMWYKKYYVQCNELQNAITRTTPSLFFFNFEFKQIFSKILQVVDFFLIQTQQQHDFPINQISKYHFKSQACNQKILVWITVKLYYHKLVFRGCFLNSMSQNISWSISPWTNFSLILSLFWYSIPSFTTTSISDSCGLFFSINSFTWKENFRYIKYFLFGTNFVCHSKEYNMLGN